MGAALGLAAQARSAVSVSTPKGPGIPSNVMALAGNASAFVQWKGRGQPATSYTVTASPGGQSVTVPASGVNGTATVPGLTNGTAYTFAVVATNAVGSSLPSGASNSVTPTALPSSILPVTRGLEFMWDADQVTGLANGAFLDQMTDISGNGYHALPQASAQRGTWATAGPNGKPALLGNGSSQRYDTITSGLRQGMRSINNTLYVIYAPTANPAAAGKVSGRIVSTETNALVISSAFGVAVGATSGQSNPELVQASLGFNQVLVEGPTQGSLTAPVYVTVVRPGAAFRVNGTPVATTVEPAVSQPNNPWGFLSTIGGAFNNYYQGYLRFVAICADVHTPSEIALNEAVLASKL